MKAPREATHQWDGFPFRGITLPHSEERERSRRRKGLLLYYAAARLPTLGCRHDSSQSRGRSTSLVSFIFMRGQGMQNRGDDAGRVQIRWKCAA